MARFSRERERELLLLLVVSHLYFSDARLYVNNGWCGQRRNYAWKGNKKIGAVETTRCLMLLLFYARRKVVMQQQQKSQKKVS